MKSRQEEKVKAGLRPFLEDGEEVLAAIICAPRGHTLMIAGAQKVGRGPGAMWQGINMKAGEVAGLPIAYPMAMALTTRRLLTVAIGTPIGLGVGGEVKGLLGALPVSAVDAIEPRWLALGWRVRVVVGEWNINVEANALAHARDLARRFEEVKSAVGG